MSDLPQKEPARIAREKRTIRAMIDLYCRSHHSPGQSLCAECQALFDYAVCRLDRCPFGARKATCVQCPVHCYSAAMRARTKAVMRYAGPRMLFHHPILAIRHQLDGLFHRRFNRPSP